MNLDQLNERSRYNDNDTDWDMYDEDGNFLAQIAGEPSEESAIAHYNNYMYMSHESEALAAKAVAVTYYPKEGKSPHKKGTKKYNSHMAAMHAEGYKVLPPMDSKYVERDGLEGPFTTLSGKVVYYDPKEGKYYDPDTDMYMSYDEWNAHNSDRSGMSEGSFWGRDDMVKKMRDEEKANGMVRLRKQTETATHGVTVPQDRVQHFLDQGYSIVDESIEEDQGLTDNKFSPKQIKMAFGILNDPRYKGGNYDGAYGAIEKVARGLARHPSVSHAMKRANESHVWIAKAEETLGREITNEEKAELNEYWPIVAALGAATKVNPMTYAGVAIGALDAASKAVDWIRSKMTSEGISEEEGHSLIGRAMSEAMINEVPWHRTHTVGNTTTSVNSRTGGIKATQVVGNPAGAHTVRSVNNHFNADGSRGQASATTTVGNNKVSVSGQIGGGVDPKITVKPIVKPKVNASKVREETEYSDKQIKMAFGILNDPRYRDGNYDGAYATIEKVAKGLARHPSVRNALKRANESINTNRRT